MTIYSYNINKVVTCYQQVWNKLLRTCNNLVVQIQLVDELFAGSLLKVVRFLPDSV